MILVVGGTGNVGSALVKSLLDSGMHVRILTRDAKKATSLKLAGAQVYVGDLRDADSLARACRGVDKVVAAAHAFMGVGESSPKAVDGVGNRELIHAARRADVQRFVFISWLGVRADHPIDFFRQKHEAESALQASGLEWSILRPAPFMDDWAAQVGEPVLKDGRTRIFGRGANPISFIAAADVAQFAALALRGQLAREIIEIGGPQALTMHEVAAAFARFCGHAPQITYVTKAAMHLMAGVTGTMRPAYSRQVQTAIALDTQPMVIDMTPVLARFPLHATTLEEFIAARYGRRLSSPERKPASV
jgi:uncharacterized protein YbjT (DUF2867 family)